MTLARFLRTAHLALGLFWTAMIPVSIVTGLKHSIPYLIGISVYAIAIGHLSAWQGSRSEVATVESAQKVEHADSVEETDD